MLIRLCKAKMYTQGNDIAVIILSFLFHVTEDSWVPGYPGSLSRVPCPQFPGSSGPLNIVSGLNGLHP